MTLIKDFENINIDRSWATVGSFDGVHLGHQFLARQLVEGAHQEKSQAVVVTFSPHPAVFFKRAPLANNLTLADERDILLKQLGIDQIITIQFDKEIAALSAEEFMAAMKEKMGVTRLLVGFNFAMGRNRSGDIPTLEELGAKLNYAIDVIPPFVVNGEVVSSSQIRKFLTEGRLDLANQCLGRPYTLEGQIIHGEHRGNRLGFPTANMDISPTRLLPKKGVYASKAIIDGEVLTAVTNIGVRPTFANPLDSPRVEPYLLDVHDDLYGKFLKLELIEYLREEKAFDTPDDLINQVNRDIEKTRKLLDHGK